MNKSLLSSTYNTRDIGGYMTAAGTPLKKDVIWRSDRIIAPAAEDIALLREKNITTVIDLRTAEEVTKNPHGLSDIAGFDYHNLPITEGSRAPDSVDAVAESYINIAGSASAGDIFRTISGAEGGVIYNCSAGKDRTGVITAILHKLCGVSDEMMIHDYMLTKVNCERELRAFAELHPELDVNIIIPREEYITGFMERFKERYGSPADYLRAVGLTYIEISGITRKLMG